MDVPALPGFKPRDLPDLSGTRAVVTGANSGIGFHAAAALARAGAEVVLACRSTAKGAEAAKRIRGRVSVERLDLASQTSVREFAEGFEGSLDLLVNNAGVMTPPSYRETPEGQELQFGTNHLGHFALTGLLLPRLLKSPTPRVVTVSSIAHHRGDESVLEGNPPTSYEPSKAYGNSKLANLLFAFELHRRSEAAGSALVSTAAHPGVSATNLVGSSDGMGSNALVRATAPFFMPVLFQSSGAGANPTLWAATFGQPGSYVGPQWLMESRGRLGEAKLSRHARNEDLGRRLWDLSEATTGVTFDLTL